MPPRPTPNLERFIVDRYNAAQAFLHSDAEAAEKIFLELLNEPRLPLWIRTQCNVNSALLTDDLIAAPLYLLDARHTLELYEASNVASGSESVASNVANMHDAFKVVEDRIAYRLAHPEEEDEPEDEPQEDDLEVVQPEEDDHDAGESEEAQSEAALLEEPAVARVGTPARDDQGAETEDDMLLGYTETEEAMLLGYTDAHKEAAERGSPEADDMLLGYHGDDFDKLDLDKSDDLPAHLVHSSSTVYAPVFSSGPQEESATDDSTAEDDGSDLPSPRRS
ncbi:hypothetical protein LTR53_002744 [Teratosphaeriaceae sp. CCFEE 6253]|nr:hypothetical protein LTR53_002744 [Teratosphaeriaceae sp. CCFEE 6253]